MESEIHNAPAPEVLKELAARADRLIKPTDYYSSGLGFFNKELPKRLICFARRKPLELAREGVRFHHHRWIVIASLKGSGRVIIEEEQHLLQPGEIIVIFPFQFHSFSHVDSSLNWLFLSFELPDEQKEGQPQGPQSLVDFDARLLNECLASWMHPAQHHLCPLYLSLLLQRLKDRPRLRDSDASTHEDSTLLTRVNQIILGRIHHPYGLKELAGELGYSESHLRARFRQATTMSLGKHLRNLRLRNACRLLHSEEISISEIAEACGFENVFTFSRAFRTSIHQSPTEYRRQFRRQN